MVRNGTSYKSNFNAEKNKYYNFHYDNMGDLTDKYGNGDFKTSEIKNIKQTNKTIEHGKEKDAVAKIKMVNDRSRFSKPNQKPLPYYNKKIKKNMIPPRNQFEMKRYSRLVPKVDAKDYRQARLTLK